MTINVGKFERVIRIVAGAIIVSLVFVGPKTDWAWIGLIPLVTGIVGWCPPYALLGWNTAGKKEES